MCCVDQLNLQVKAAIRGQDATLRSDQWDLQYGDSSADVADVLNEPRLPRFGCLPAADQKASLRRGCLRLWDGIVESYAT